MMQVNFSPFPVLETERLLLRRVAAGDVREVYELRSNPETMKYIPRTLVTNEDEAQNHIAMINDKIDNNQGINWAVTLKGNPKLIGFMGHYKIHFEHYRSEIGYMLLPEYAGKGIISEAIKAIVDYGFSSMGLHSVEAVIDPGNIASEKALVKCGFIKEAHILENEYFEGKFWDTVIYSMLKRNFKK